MLKVVLRNASTVLSVADSETEIELAMLKPAVTETVVPAVLALTTWDMRTSQLRKVSTGFMVKTVSVEQRAPRARVGSPSEVAELVAL
jgi:hypothetical protein